MKWLCCLFAFYLLALPCIPCNGIDACCEDAMSSISSSASDEDRPDNAPVCLCCPSFSCNKCHTITSQEIKMSIECDKVVLKISLATFKQELPTPFASGIFQPPRLS